MFAEDVGLLTTRVLHFNGKLVKESSADGYSPLLKSALNPTERHALGAHCTPRAYVEWLVLPNVVAPLRAEWANAQAAALALAHEAANLEGNPPVATGGVDAAGFDRQQLKAYQDASKRHEAAVRAKWREARAQLKALTTGCAVWACWTSPVAMPIFCM